MQCSAILEAAAGGHVAVGAVFNVDCIKIDMQDFDRHEQGVCVCATGVIWKGVNEATACAQDF